jgi:hypothetical protein
MPTFEKKRKIEVIAKAKAGGGGGYNFEMIEEKEDKSKIKREGLFFDKKEDQVYELGWYKVEFKLDRPSGSDLKFHEDQDEVFWIGPPDKDGCPSPYSSHHPITFERINDSKIVVKNPDNHFETLAFALGFQEGDDPTPIRYDPVWGNQNGGVKLGGGPLLVAGATVAGLAALAAWAVRRTRSDPSRMRSQRKP